jgi:hypothetical protein
VLEPEPAWPKTPLTPGELVDTLDRLDLLELAGESPWPDISDDESAFPIGWDMIDGDSTLTSDTAVLPEDIETARWDIVQEELRSRVGNGGGTPPPILVDALAWYQPIHYFGHNWGIYIRESAVLELTACLLESAPADRRFDRDVMLGALRTGLAVLYLHEAFHHRIESFAIGLEIVEHSKRYCPYHDRVFKPLRSQGSHDLLEETLATAESYRRLREPVYRHSAPTDFRKFSRSALRTWIRSLPPGYNSAEWYIAGGPFESALHELCSQVQEAEVVPKRDHYEWRLASQIHRGLFNCKSSAWVTVPIGTQPIVPWFGTDILALSVSTRRLIKALREGHGYEETTGSKHLKLIRSGMPTLVLPANREALSIGVLTNTARSLGYRSAADMWETLAAG